MTLAEASANDVAYAAAALVLTAFAIWLLILSPRQRATRALAILLFGMSTMWILDLVWGVVEPRHRLPLTLITPVAMCVIGLATVYFLSVYPRPRGWLGRSRWGAWTTLAVGAAFTLLFLRAPDLYQRFEVVDGSPTHVDNGPLVLLGNAWTLTSLAMIYVFAFDLRRTPPGPVRRSLLLVFAAFLTSMLVWTGALFLNDVSGRLEGSSIDASYSRLSYILEETSFLATLVAAAIVVVPAWRSPVVSIRREGRALAGLVTGVVGCVGLVTFLGGPPAVEDWVSPAQGIADALGGMAIAAFCGYALLKHRLFDIDLKLKWTIRRGTVAAIFVAVFFAVSQVAQNFLAESYGWMAGGLVAGLLLFAITPLQRVADRVAAVAMPGVREGDMGTERRAIFYRTAVAMALSDSIITREEERHLARLAEQLGLSHTEALRMREEVEAETVARSVSA